MTKFQRSFSKFLNIFFYKKIKFELLKHNQSLIQNYKSKSFFLIPFPKEKSPIFNYDNLATSNNHFFLKDKKFISAKSKAEKRWKTNSPRNISWRLHFVLYFINFCLRNASKEDIFIECGTGKGYMAEAIFNYFKWNENNPPFFLIDTFLSYNADNNADQKKNKNIPFCYCTDFNEIQDNFLKYNNVNILKGRCPEVLKKIPSKKKVIFAHIDLNNATSELETMKFLFNNNLLKKGSVIIFDDYGANKKLSKILLNYLKKLKKDILMSPTGQGIIIF